MFRPLAKLRAALFMNELIEGYRALSPLSALRRRRISGQR
jgi:hypothetical protein